MTWPGSDPLRGSPYGGAADGTAQPPDSVWARPSEPARPDPPPAAPPGEPPRTAPPPPEHPGQAYGPGHWGQPGQPHAYPGPPHPPYGSRPTNGLAIAALVCSLAGLVTVISAPVGAVLGHVAQRQVAQTGEEGASMAKAAIWIGWIITGLAVAACCGFFALAVAAGRSGEFRF